MEQSHDRIRSKTSKSPSPIECGLWHNNAYAKFNHITYEKWKYGSDHLEKVMKKYEEKQKEIAEKRKPKPKKELEKEPIRRTNMDTEQPKLTVKLLQGVEHVYREDKELRCPYDKDLLCSSKCLFYSSKSTETFQIVKCRDFVMGQTVI